LGDPSKLLSSASRLYGEKMLPLFGEFLPVPSENLRVLYGGETLPFGDNYLRVLYTPGHASHHVTYFDRSEGIAFVGDTAGICIEGHPFALPAAPPPDINVETWIQSLEVIAQLNPRRLFLTHFGFSDNPSRHLASYRNRLQHWSDIASRILASGAEDSAAMQEFIRQISDEAAPLLNADESRHYLYNGNVPLSWLGLARYHRKRSAAPA
jgi:glyoxylase-like metal-dependent hydrolase (beta-lactamase superfamily II)